MTTLQEPSEQLNQENYTSHFYSFQDRQAGVGLVFSPEENRYFYNAYCVERTLLTELFSVEHEFLDDALASINDEFGQWELKAFEKKKEGCGTCVAKPVSHPKN